jgi:hypothetical protein
MIDSAKRILVIALETLREIVIYNRWFQLCLFGLLIFVLGCQTLTELPLGSSLPKLLFDVGQGIIVLTAGTVLVILLAFQLTTEIQSGLIYSYLVSRVSRSEYLIGKLIGGWVSLVLVVLVADGVLAAIIEVQAFKNLIPGGEVLTPGIWEWLQTFLFQSLHLLVLASLTLCILTLSNSFLFPAVTTLAIWLAGLFLVGVGDFDNSATGFAGAIVDLLRLVLPRFEMWSLVDRLWYEGALTFIELIKSILINLIYCIFLVGVGLAMFKHKEL